MPPTYSRNQSLPHDPPGLNDLTLPLHTPVSTFPWLTLLQPHWPYSSSTAPLVLRPQGLCTGCSLHLGTLFHQTPTWPPTQMSFLRHDFLRETVPDPLSPHITFQVDPTHPLPLPFLAFFSSPPLLSCPLECQFHKGKGFCLLTAGSAVSRIRPGTR